MIKYNTVRIKESANVVYCDGDDIEGDSPFESLKDFKEELIDSIEENSELQMVKDINILKLMREGVVELMSARVKDGYEPLDYFKKKHGPKILDYTDDGVNCIIGINMTEERLLEIIKDRKNKGAVEPLTIINAEMSEAKKNASEYTASIYLSNKEKEILESKGIDPRRVFNGEITIAQMDRIIAGEDVQLVINPIDQKQVKSEDTDTVPEGSIVTEDGNIVKKKKLFKRRNVVVTEDVEEKNSESIIKEDSKVSLNSDTMSDLFNSLCMSEDENTVVAELSDTDDEGILECNKIELDIEDDEDKNGYTTQEDLKDQLAKTFKECGIDYDLDNEEEDYYDNWDESLDVIDEEEEESPKQRIIYFNAPSKRSLDSWQRVLVKTYPDIYKIGVDPKIKLEEARRKREDKIRKKKEKTKNMTQEELESYEYNKELKSYMKENNKFRRNTIIPSIDKAKYKKYIKQQDKINNSYAKYMRDSDETNDITDVIELVEHMRLEKRIEATGGREFFRKKKYWEMDDPFKRYRDSGNIITVSEAARYKEDFSNSFMKNLEMEILHRVNSPINIDGETVIEYYDKHGRLKSKEVVSGSKNKSNRDKEKKRKKNEINNHLKKISKQFDKHSLW